MFVVLLLALGPCTTRTDRATPSPPFERLTNYALLRRALRLADTDAETATSTYQPAGGIDRRGSRTVDAPTLSRFV
jgi:hypothetical protein